MSPNTIRFTCVQMCIRHITRNPFGIEVTSAQLNLQSSVKPMFASNLDVKRISCIKVCDFPLVELRSKLFNMKFIGRKLGSEIFGLPL